MTKKNFERISEEAVKARLERIKNRATDAYGLIATLAEDCFENNAAKAADVVNKLRSGIRDFSESYNKVKEADNIEALAEVITNKVCALESENRLDAILKLATGMKTLGKLEEAEEKQLDELIEKLTNALKNAQSPILLTDEEVKAWAEELVHIAHLAGAEDALGITAEEKSEEEGENDEMLDETEALFRAAAIYTAVKAGEIKVDTDSVDEEELAYQIGVGTASRMQTEKEVRNGKSAKVLKVIATVALIVGACGIIAASGSWVFAAIAAKQIMETKAAVMVASLAAGVVGWLMFGTLEDYKDRHRSIENYVIDVKDTAMEAKEAAKKAAEAAKAAYEEVKPRAKAAMNIMGDFLKAKVEKINEKLDERIEKDIIDVETEEEYEEKNTVKA